MKYLKTFNESEIDGPEDMDYSVIDKFMKLNIENSNYLKLSKLEISDIKNISTKEKWNNPRRYESNEKIIYQYTIELIDGDIYIIDINDNSGRYQLNTNYGFILKKRGDKYVPLSNTIFIETGKTWLATLNTMKNGKYGINNKGYVNENLIKVLIKNICNPWLRSNGIK